MDKRFSPDIIAAARASQHKWRVPASISLAQWALESAYGRRVPSGSNNPFGIKAKPGEPFVCAMTWERLGGKDIRLEQRFRKFASLDEAFDAHGRLLATSRSYTKAMALTAEPDHFARALTGIYATYPRYGDKLISIMAANRLYRLDMPDIAIAARPIPSAASPIVGNALDPAPARGPSPAPASATPATPTPTAKDGKMSAAPAINFGAGFANVFENLAHSIFTGAAAVESPDVETKSSSGNPILDFGADIADAKRAGSEILEIVGDFRSKNLVGGVDDAIDLARIVFGALDRHGVKVPIVTDAIKSIDLDPAG